MMTDWILRGAAAVPIVLPLTAACGLAATRLSGTRVPEAAIERLVRWVMLAVCASVLALAWRMGGGTAAWLHYGRWFSAGHYAFDVDLLVDRLSLSYLITASFIASIVGYFSARYLHREPGFARYFIWYLTFVAGLNLLVLAGGFNLLVAGWELVGLSSVFLVGFYGQRSGPAGNGLLVFTAYRVADVGLLGAAAVIHLWLGSDRLPVWQTLEAFPTGSLAVVGSLLIVWAAMGKSAQGPFAFWLPRAMEGPTPSSAIFYGALSVHAGAYLLLRSAPVWMGLPQVRVLIIGVGLATAAYGAIVGRTRTDVKSLLAHASLAQVGLIFAEIGAGYHTLALWHLVGHAMVRTLQFLRAPSAIDDWRRFRPKESTSGLSAALARAFLSQGLVLWAYRQSLGGLHLERLLSHFVVEPVLRFARFLDFSERELALAWDDPSRPRPLDAKADEGETLPQLEEAVDA